MVNEREAIFIAVIIDVAFLRKYTAKESWEILDFLEECEYNLLWI
jgi:hypothetical protein